MNKNDLIEKIFELEDKFEAESKLDIQKKVYQEMDKLYGGEGVRICNIYYNENDNETAQEECEECAEKAKKLTEELHYGNSLVDSLTSSDIESAYNILMNETNLKNDFKHYIDKVKENCNQVGLLNNDVLLRNIILKITLEQFRQKQEGK